MPSFQVRRVVLRNYRTLRLVSDSLDTRLDHALRDRGGIQQVRRRSTGHPTHFTVRLEFLLGSSSGTYEFRVGALGGGGYEVSSETCTVVSGEFGDGRHSYKVRSGSLVESTMAAPPPVVGDRRCLVSATGLPEFRPVYDGLSRMGSYNLAPERLREPQSPDAGVLLARDGSNVASVVDRLDSYHPKEKAVIEDYLGRVVPGLLGVDRESIGPMETLTFRQRVEAPGAPGTSRP